jgi:ribosomal protein S27E
MAVAPEKRDRRAYAEPPSAVAGVSCPRCARVAPVSAKRTKCPGCGRVLPAQKADVMTKAL